ncbi:DUF6924 domain-containing protein [Streptomyces kroppenstedtii]|uniref:DUF6924 domain-containing protein n=1 Tax=Streptomyces kroppenstedtii TaxID=3051181 RepID=UPI0028D144CA|nr:hypothetical protein [Streptomyces sp. DSM 40484]
MRVLPKTDADYPPLLLVRTDYRDDDGWQRVLAALDQPWVFDEGDEDNGRLKEDIVQVDDPAWADATPSDVLAALTAPGEEDGEASDECGWPVVFLADHASMEGAEPTLLAVSPDPEEETEPYRIPALETPHEMHCNLAIANMDFDEFGG